jgi:hypothetical protein
MLPPTSKSARILLVLAVSKDAPMWRDPSHPITHRWVWLEALPASAAPYLLGCPVLEN